MKAVKKKLGARDGVTIVFALVIFLILSLFSYGMVNAALTTAQSAAVSARTDQIAYSSVHIAVELLQDKLKRSFESNDIDANRFEYTPGDERPWKWNGDMDNLLTETMANALNGAAEKDTLILTADNAEIETLFRETTVVMTAEHIDADRPSVTFQISQGAYRMTMTLTAPETGIKPNGMDGYTVTFLDKSGELQAEITH